MRRACGLRLRTFIALSTFSGLAGAGRSHLETHLSGRPQKYILKAVGESEAGARWPRHAALHTHSQAVTASSCCRTSQPVLQVTDLAEHSSTWHLENPRTCLLLTFYPCIQHFQIPTKRQALHQAPEMQRWTNGDAQSLVREMDICSEIQIQYDRHNPRILCRAQKGKRSIT